jgi:adenine-specific DNA methylase
MNRVPVVFVGLCLVAGSASAIDWKSQSFSTKRQAASMVIDCMKKRMLKDRLISYNEAGRLCKQEVSKQFEGAPSGPLVASSKP